ncbi:MAG: heavy metal-associated domain-containing protein [bacterium]|nr:heavy metal-associated domain-containing protein [bacterium]
MKSPTIFKFILAASLFLGSWALKSQSAEKKTETFKVYGNCEMCEEKIEGVLKKKDGISKKDWDSKTKNLTVTYDPALISSTQIKQKIANAGYDTDEIKAKDEAYNKLPKCCHYERATL